MNNTHFIRIFNTMEMVVLFLQIVETQAQILNAPQANVGRRKFYLQFSGDLQKLQRLAGENKINEMIQESELTLLYNTPPRYRVVEMKISGKTRKYYDIHRYKMHTLYFRVIGRHLPIERSQADSGKKFAAEFGTQQIFSTEKTAAITAGCFFSSNKQEVVLGRYMAVLRRMFLEAHYTSASRTQSLSVAPTMIHVPSLTFGAQFLRVSGSEMNRQSRDRTFVEMGASLFLRTALIYTQGTAPDLGAEKYTSITGGGEIRAQLLVDFPAAQSSVMGAGSNVTLGGYAEAASMYAAGVEKSPYFVNTGGRAVNFEWGFVLRLPFYGTRPRHFNIPKKYKYRLFARNARIIPAYFLQLFRHNSAYILLVAKPVRATGRIKSHRNRLKRIIGPSELNELFVFRYRNHGRAAASAPLR